MKPYYLIFIVSFLYFNISAQHIQKNILPTFDMAPINFFSDKKKQNNYNFKWRKEQHFDIFYPNIDSLDYGQTQGIFWRIHQDFEPEEYIQFNTPDGTRDSLNVKFKNAVVTYKWLNDSFNEDSVTIAFEDAGPITIDTIYYLYAHANRSGELNRLRTRVMPVNITTGQPMLNAEALWEDVLETDTSLTAVNNNPDSLFLDVRVIPVNLTLETNEPFAVVVDFSGGNKTEDELNLLATYNKPCGDTRVAQQSKFYANSYYEISALVSGLPIERLFPENDLSGLGFDFDDDGEVGESIECENFYIQNWHIGTTVTFDAAFKANIIASEDTICLNDAVELDGKGLFGEAPYRYNWTPTAGLTEATSETTSAAPTETTTYTLTVTDATDAEAKVSHTIYVNDLAVELGDEIRVACGRPHQIMPSITNTFGRELRYEWNHGLTDSIVPLFPGNYNLIIKDGNCEATDDVEITLMDSDLIVDFAADNIYHAVVAFNNLSENTNFFNWDFGDGNTSSEESPQHEYISGGTYQVSLNGTSGNCSYTKFLTIEVGAASSVFDIEKIEGIRVSPNPAQDMINFEIDSSLLNESFEILLYDILGNLIKKQEYNQYDLKSQFVLPVSPAGIYFLTIKTNEHQYNKKMLIEN